MLAGIEMNIWVNAGFEIWLILEVVPILDSKEV